MWRTPFLPEKSKFKPFGKPCGQLRTTLQIIHVFHNTGIMNRFIHNLFRGILQGDVERSWGFAPNPTKGMIPLEPHLPAALVKGILLSLVYIMIFLIFSTAKAIAFANRGAGE